MADDGTVATGVLAPLNAMFTSRVPSSVGVDGMLPAARLKPWVSRCFCGSMRGGAAAPLLKGFGVGWRWLLPTGWARRIFGSFSLPIASPTLLPSGVQVVGVAATLDKDGVTVPGTLSSMSFVAISTGTHCVTSVERRVLRPPGSSALSCLGDGLRLPGGLPRAWTPRPCVGACVLLVVRAVQVNPFSLFTRRKLPATGRSVL
mmetsp:Transcript_35490/g.93692  ORF Transcript_35490/g.93692 Transcript_35490/m.93692 type:complete len:203 (-) Transcript_35490:658-1266(-)